MPEIYNDKGKTKTGLLQVNKPFAYLSIFTDKAFNDLTTERIKIEIERTDGNFEITKGFMPLKDFIALSNYGEDCTTADIDGLSNAVCELAEEGSIYLLERELIKIELEGLDARNQYIIDTIEDFDQSATVKQFEQKTINADDKDKTFIVDAFDVMTMDNSDKIREVSFTHENGSVVKYTLREMRAIARLIDPVVNVDKNGVVSSAVKGKIIFPVEGITTVEVRKDQGESINLYFRYEN